MTVSLKMDDQRCCAQQQGRAGGLSSGQVRTLQRRHLHQPASHREVGESVKAGQVLADGPARATAKFLWVRTPDRLHDLGSNYEDAVLAETRRSCARTYTPFILKSTTESRDTKLGPEEITRDIPNVSEDALKDLDERGIIRIGAEVKSGDILVGKVTPKGETELTAEERLLRAIFGEKAREVRDTSRVPHGTASSWMSRCLTEAATNCSPACARSSVAILPRSARSALAIRWQAVTATRVSFRIRRRRPCPTWPDGTRWTSLKPWACLPA